VLWLVRKTDPVQQKQKKAGGRKGYHSMLWKAVLEHRRFPVI